MVDTPTTKKYARRKVIRTEDGSLKVVWWDPELKKEVTDLSGYTKISGDRQDNDIYQGTDRTDTEPTGPDDPPVTPPTDTPKPPAKPVKKKNPNPPKNDNDYKSPVYDSYLNRDPAQGLKPKGSILGGIVGGMIKDAIPGAKDAVTDAASSFVEGAGNTLGGLIEAGKGFGLFGGNDVTAADGTVTQTPAIDKLLKPKTYDDVGTGPGKFSDLKTMKAQAPPGAPTGAMEMLKGMFSNLPKSDVATPYAPTEGGTMGIPYDESPNYVEQPYVGSSDRTRNQPISPQLETLLTQVAKDTGVTFIVGSGGQDDAQTPNARRTGSTRHDHGDAGDVKAKDANGNLIDFSTPEGQQKWTEIIQSTQSYGATGIGAGKSYMGTDTVHIGFGTPAVWSSTESGKPVEKWLKTAYDGGSNVVVKPIAPTPMPYRPGTMPGAEPAAIQTASADGLDKLKINFGVEPVAPPVDYTGDPVNDPVIRRYLDTINRAEGSPMANQGFDYTEITDLSKHPNVYNKEYNTTAAGYLQANAPTWYGSKIKGDPGFAAKAGVTDFSLESQLKVGWEIAKENYKVKTKGGDLYEALKSNDPKLLASTFVMNQNRWASLPSSYQDAMDIVNEYTGLRDIATGAVGPMPSRGTTSTIPPTVPNINTSFAAVPTKPSSAVTNIGAGVTTPSKNAVNDLGAATKGFAPVNVGAGAAKPKSNNDGGLVGTPVKAAGGVANSSPVSGTMKALPTSSSTSKTTGNVASASKSTGNVATKQPTTSPVGSFAAKPSTGGVAGASTAGFAAKPETKSDYSSYYNR